MLLNFKFDIANAFPTPMLPANHMPAPPTSLNQLQALLLLLRACTYLREVVVVV